MLAELIRTWISLKLSFLLSRKGRRKGGTGWGGGGGLELAIGKHFPQ